MDQEKAKNLNLVVVAHPDDEILGFGGAGYKLVKKGEIVQPIILSANVDVRYMRPSDEKLLNDIYQANDLLGFDRPILGSFPNIRMNNVDHIELVKFIEKYIVEFKPTRIFTHHPNDLNNDHTQISLACMAASRLFQRRNDIEPIESLYFMEISSSTDWSFNTGVNQFQANIYYDIEDSISQKIGSLRKYENVMRDMPHPRSDEALRALAQYRGSQAGFNYAEAFQLVFKRGFGDV